MSSGDELLFDSCEKDFQQCLTHLESLLRHADRHNFTSRNTPSLIANVCDRQPL